jgi:hypothetical protein
LIDVEHGEPRPSASVEKRMQLTYSRNALLQPIILPALIAVGALISVARGASNIDSSSCLCVERSSVLQHAFDIGQLIVAELPFPKLTLELLQSALLRCETANCLVPADESWLRCDIRMLLVLHAAIAPILEAYFVLMRTIPAAVRSVSVKQATSTVEDQALLPFIQRLLRASASACAEEQSFEMIKNVMRVLEQRRIICTDESRKHFSLPSGTVFFFSLTTFYFAQNNVLHIFIFFMCTFRRINVAAHLESSFARARQHSAGNQ